MPARDRSPRSAGRNVTWIGQTRKDCFCLVTAVVTTPRSGHSARRPMREALEHRFIVSGHVVPPILTGGAFLAGVASLDRRSYVAFRAVHGGCELCGVSEELAGLAGHLSAELDVVRDDRCRGTHGAQQGRI